MLRRYYDDMKRYVAFLSSTATDHIVTTGLGDWYDIELNWGIPERDWPARPVLDRILFDQLGLAAYVELHIMP